VIYASGSEVGLALKVAESLKKQYDVSVVSMPCTQIFDKQSDSYKAKVMQKSAKLQVAIEASNDNIWYKYVGSDGLVVSVDNYAKCGNGEEVYKSFGFDEKEIVRKIIKKLAN